MDCDEGRDAQFYLQYDYWFRKEYNLPKKVPICAGCLINILGDGMMGGGGPISSDIIKIQRIDRTDRYGRRRWQNYIKMKQQNQERRS